MSLPSVLLLVTIVLMVAATMAGVFTMNMNITQRVSNGSMALAEAEAGVAEVLYHITREENVEGDKDSKTAQVSWGRNGETLRSTITPGMSEDEAYHVVTFDPSSSFPHSTNNTYLDSDSGDLGRTVPDGMIHIISTGYCKGQYRTVEAIVERPPFPFGLATSGAINSRDPIVVTGVSSLANFVAGEEDRPGHILCNSPDGVTIGAAPSGVDSTTQISGFVKSVGPVNIAQPAVVRGGIRSFADPSTITNIKVSDFQLAGEPGVVTVLDDRYDQPQNLDVMYNYSGSHLQYMSQVHLNNAMLYVDGDLTIHGPVSGVGLIVVDGNATFKSGSALSGSNKMAVICSGDVTIEGNSNYFTGLVYCEGNLNATNITILGNAIVNSSDPSKGSARLRNVKFVSNEETAEMVIPITSSTQATATTNLGNGSMPNVFAGPQGFGHVNGADGSGWIDANVTDGNLDFIASNQLLNGVMGPAFADTAGEIPPMVYPPGGVGDAGYIWAQAESLRAMSVAALAERNRIDSEIAELERQLDAVTGNDQDAEDERDRIRSQISGLESDLSDYQDQMEADFQEAARTMLEQMREYAATHTDASGTLESEIVDMDIEIDKEFVLNRYLPQSERVKVSYWKVHPRRL